MHIHDLNLSGSIIVNNVDSFMFGKGINRVSETDCLGLNLR